MIIKNNSIKTNSYSLSATLKEFVSEVHYATFLGINTIVKGNKLTSVLPYSPKLIGNPAIPALHGGVTASFLEISAVLELFWASIRAHHQKELGNLTKPKQSVEFSHSQIPKTIDFTVDYLRPGLPKDAYARAEIKRAGRRYASVYVEAWQDNKKKLYAQASGHFLMPLIDG
jgi:acyl-coenzyme A thioesterase PaaI-like protein